MACKSECYRPPKISTCKQLRTALRGGVASQSQKPQQAVNVHIPHSNAPGKSSSEEKSETAAKSQNDSTARQANPITAIPDAWDRLIGPHNIAPIRLNGLETMVLLDPAAQIPSISKQWVEYLGLPLYELENIVDIEQADGSILDYESFTEVTIISNQISGLELNIPLLVVPYISYHDQVPITLGTLTLKNIIKVLENTPTLSPRWKYVQQSLELTEKLETNPEEVLGVAKLSKDITILAFQTKGVHCLSKAKNCDMKVNVIVENKLD